MKNNKIVVLGGYGTFGSLISSQLAASGNLFIVGRNHKQGQEFSKSIGANFVHCDIEDKDSLGHAIQEAKIVINTTGPFISGNYSIPKYCIEQGCNYIDLADGRDYVSGFNTLNNLAKKNKVFACTGASTAPAITYAMISNLLEKSDAIESIKIAMNAGNKNKPGISTFKSILMYTGTNIQVWENGHWKTRMGWGQSEIFEFPSPVGKRLVQLCDVPDLDLFPKVFKASTVIFKAGVELSFFNLGLSILAYMKKTFHQIDLVSLAKPLVKTSRFFKLLGSYSGGISVTVETKDGRKYTASFVTTQNGPYIPASPAVILTRKLLFEDHLLNFGAFPCIGFIDLKEFQRHLSPYGVKLVL